MIQDTERAISIAETQSLPGDSPATPLHGSVLVLIQFDVCEEIKLDQLRQIFGARTQEQPNFKHAAPGYVRYQRPPVVESIEPLVLESGERLMGQIKYYDYGVLSVIFELPFSGDWDTLVRPGWPLDLGCRFRSPCHPSCPGTAEKRRARAGQALSGVA